jgi:DNA-binding helix-hairpin-helix protein with protein kinase domain
MKFTLWRARTSIRLGQELGRGGEGAVCAIEGQPDRAAKIYTASPDQTKFKKLIAMVEAASSPLLRIAAWPIDILIDVKGVMRGFIMPRIIARRDVHELYGPKSRSEAFPEADFRFLVHVGANIARAFAVVHENGHVLGDINHGNLLVGQDGTVTLIDCDSFQISTRSNVFTCDVGAPLFTAPELQGRSLRGVVRSANHDQFALAIILFHILYMGRHPFAGRYSGPGDMPIEKAIAEYRFAYGPDHRVNGMERPPGTVALETMGADIAKLFIRAFGRVATNGVRPDAKTWLEALERLKSKLRVCVRANWHHFPNDLPGCPWCVVESQTGARLFGQRIVVVGPTGTIDVAALWRAISRVPDPGPDPPLPSEQSWRPPPGVKLPSNSLKTFRHFLSVAFICSGLATCTVLAKDGGFVWALALYGLAFAVWPRVSPEQRAAAERTYSAAKVEWESALSSWKREASHEPFVEKLRALDKVRAELADLPNERRRRLAKLEAEREMRQRQRYLDRFRIDRAKIKGIGSGRTAMLASYGIETAADVNRANIMQIPGFGEALTSELVAWRRLHERNFRFNPSESIDRRDIDSIDQDLTAKRQKLFGTLQEGVLVLQRLSQGIAPARQRLMPILEKTWAALKIAEASRNCL